MGGEHKHPRATPGLDLDHIAEAVNERWAEIGKRDGATPV